MFNSSQGLERIHGDNLEQYWRAVILKSGNIFYAGTYAGAAVATDRQEWLEALGEYGTCLGVMLQVIDDCRDDLRDRLERPDMPGLPALLGNQLGKEHEKTLPEVLSQILNKWRSQALLALSKLPDSLAMKILRQIPDHILNQNQMG